MSFDRTGNVYPEGESRTYELQTDRLLTRVAGGWSWSYTYNGAGNLTQAVGDSSTQQKRWHYFYDGAGQLRWVRYKAPAWPADSLIAHYGYDVLGRRIAKRVYRKPLPDAVLGETRYLYQGGQVSAETDAAGAIKWKYTWGPGTDNLVGVQDATGTMYYVVQDQLGSVRGLVKRDGTWIMSQRFTPYGRLQVRDNPNGDMPTGFHIGWTGREYDAETGLSFHRARYYSAELRRWTQEDPIGYGGGGNLYAYVGGAVLAARDPSGMIGEVVSTGAIENPQDPTTGVGGIDQLGGGMCLVFCTEARDREDQKWEKWFNDRADEVHERNRRAQQGTREDDPDILACQANPVCREEYDKLSAQGTILLHRVATKELKEFCPKDHVPCSEVTQAKSGSLIFTVHYDNSTYGMSLLSVGRARTDAAIVLTHEFAELNAYLNNPQASDRARHWYAIDVENRARAVNLPLYGQRWWP